MTPAAGVEGDRPFSWLEDPERPLDSEIARITGLSDEQLAGQAIDEARAVALLNSASVVISHNVTFDRPFVEERLPAIRGLPWACSCRETGWGEHGFDGRSLGWLVAQAGWFHEGHRALTDVDALITLLRHDLNNGITPLSVLMENAQRSTWIVRRRSSFRCEGPLEGTRLSLGFCAGRMAPGGGGRGAGE